MCGVTPQVTTQPWLWVERTDPVWPVFRVAPSWPKSSQCIHVPARSITQYSPGPAAPPLYWPTLWMGLSNCQGTVGRPSVPPISNTDEASGWRRVSVQVLPCRLPGIMDEHVCCAHKDMVTTLTLVVVTSIVGQTTLVGGRCSREIR